ncbi:Uncharacterised protein [Corynebacterium striatum]|nr:Uncharacterised protein [Corynebacterium striatum]
MNSLDRFRAFTPEGIADLQTPSVGVTGNYFVTIWQQGKLKRE